MARTHTACLIVLSLVVFVAATSPEARAEKLARLHTVAGDIDFLLYETDTPLTVQNFLNYVNDGDYANTFFHRLAYSYLDPFVLQGGGFTCDPETDTWARVPTDDPVTNEPGISNTYGTVAMAKLGDDPNSATSQFFINLGDNSFLDDPTNNEFTVFAHVANGTMAVVEELARAPVYDAQYYIYSETEISDTYSAFSELPLVGYDPFAAEPDVEDSLALISSVEIFEPGDINTDGVVDASDLATLGLNWSPDATDKDWMHGDFTGDGAIGPEDLAALGLNWNPGVASTPEPMTLGMLAVGAVGLLRRKRRR